MRGPVELSVNSSCINYSLKLFHNISFLIGNGGTGKSMLVDFINRIKYKEAFDCTLKSNVDVIILNDQVWELVKESNKSRKRLFIIDEDFRFLKTNEFLKYIYDSNAFFLIISRTRKLFKLLIDVEAIYRFDSKNENGKTFNFLVKEYTRDLDNVCESYKIKTEDSKSGYCLIKRLGYRCEKPLGGAGNVKPYLNSCDRININLFVDTVAFGEFMPLIRERNKLGDDIRVANCKSLEHILLHNGNLSYDRDILDYTKCKCNFSKTIKSLERFYTSEYTRIAKKDLGIDYDKSKITDTMVDDKVKEKVYEILWDPKPKRVPSLLSNLEV